MLLDPTHALRCGLLMVKKVIRLTRRELWHGVQFKVGVTHGTATYDNGDWYGAAVNLASRLCAAAEPSQVLAATETLEASDEDRERWETLAPIELKGFPEPVPVAGCSVDPAQVPSIAVASELDLQGVLPLVGRESVLAELGTTWRDAASGRSRIVGLSGPPGMG